METVPDGIPDMTEIQQERFLEAISKTATFAGAARMAGISRKQAWKWRATDPQFAALAAEAKIEAKEVLATSMYERAFRKSEGGDGDTLAGMFMLKALDPETYRENIHMKHSGTIRVENVLGDMKPQDRLAIIDMVRQKQLDGAFMMDGADDGS